MGQRLGGAVSGPFSRTSPNDRSHLDYDLGLGLALAWRRAARWGAEVSSEIAGSNLEELRNEVDIAHGFREVSILSAIWQHQVGPIGLTVLPGIGRETMVIDMLGHPSYGEGYVRNSVYFEPGPAGLIMSARA